MNQNTGTAQTSTEQLLQIGAQFSEYTAENKNVSASSLDFSMHTHLDTQLPSATSGGAPIERYELQSIIEEPYTYVTADGHIYGTENTSIENGALLYEEDLEL